MNGHDRSLNTSQRRNPAEKHHQHHRPILLSAQRATSRSTGAHRAAASRQRFTPHGYPTSGRRRVGGTTGPGVAAEWVLVSIGI
jgi:hypothetical protein